MAFGGWARIAGILKSGLDGIKNAYKHPAIPRMVSSSKYMAAAGAGMMGGLATGAYKGTIAGIKGAPSAASYAHHKTGGIFLLIFPILLWLFDAFIENYQGLAFSLDNINFEGILGFLKGSPFLILAAVYILIKRPPREELPFTLAIIALFTYISGFLDYNLWIAVHLLFAMFVFGYFLKGFDRSEPVTGAHWLFLFVVIWDIFDFPIFQYLNISTINSPALDILTNHLLFPVWVFYFFVFIEDTGWKTFALLFIIIFYIGYIGFQIPAISTQLSQIPEEDRREAFSAPSRWAENLGDTFTKWITGQVRYAITGKVEKNQYEQLGVYLENVRSADQKYYEGEDITLWGTVKARTLDDPVNVKLGCFIRDGTQKIYTPDVDPKKTFPVFTLEEQDFACTFKGQSFGSRITAGSKSVTAFAEFNFETLATLKVYFMDRETLRAMTRDKKDPLEEAGIKEKIPIATYTNGPAEIGMETTSPLIGVSNSYIAFPRFSLSIKNRQGWEGRITKFNEIVLLFPKGTEPTVPDSDCNLKFSNYDGGSCRQSCSQINEECARVCDNYDDDLDKRNCNFLCGEKLNSCGDDCSILFEDEGQSYVGISLSQQELSKINEKISKDDTASTSDFEFFSCRFNPKPNEVLEDVPATTPTTKSFRSKVRYNYILEKPVSVRVDKDPTRPDTDKIGGIAITGSNEVENLIITTANSQGVDPVLALAIASVESTFRHCCAVAGQNRGLTCQGTTETSCPLDRLIISFDDSSRGIMQVCVGCHPDLFTPGTNRLLSYGCAQGETAYDLTCNIKSGVNILKENIKRCNDVWKAVGTYNAGGNCDRGQDYITKVQTHYSKISSRQLPQQGFNQVPAPTGLFASDISTDLVPKVYLGWTAPDNENVIGYIIIRQGTNGAEKIEIAGKSTNTHIDENVNYGGSYTYTIASKSQNDFRSQESGEVRVSINTWDYYSISSPSTIQ